MALRVAIFTIFAVGLGAAIPAPPPTGQCGQNAQRRSCGTACAPTCSNPNPGPFCVLPCVDACFCNEGYLKAANGECVKAENCDSVPQIPMQIPNVHFTAQESKTDDQEAKCGENEEHRVCGPSCTPTCAMPLPKPWCSLRCSKGCYCKDGYLRNKEGKCIPAMKCGTPEETEVLIDIPHGPGSINIPLQKAPSEPQCPHENEEFHTCGVQMDCLANCEPPTAPKCRERACTPGCVCRQPFVRHRDGRCVEKTQCPKLNPFAQD